MATALLPICPLFLFIMVIFSLLAWFINYLPHNTAVICGSCLERILQCLVLTWNRLCLWSIQPNALRFNDAFGPVYFSRTNFTGMLQPFASKRRPQVTLPILCRHPIPSGIHGGLMMPRSIVRQVFIVEMSRTQCLHRSYINRFQINLRHSRPRPSMADCVRIWICR